MSAMLRSLFVSKQELDKGARRPAVRGADEPDRLRRQALIAERKGVMDRAKHRVGLVGSGYIAEYHLAALRRICVIPCEEYDDLKRAIAAYKKRLATR